MASGGPPGRREREAGLGEVTVLFEFGALEDEAGEVVLGEVAVLVQLVHVVEQGVDRCP